MMIGPEPIKRIEEMSLRRGIGREATAGEQGSHLPQSGSLNPSLVASAPILGLQWLFL